MLVADASVTGGRGVRSARFSSSLADRSFNSGQFALLTLLGMEKVEVRSFRFDLALRLALGGMVVCLGVVGCGQAGPKLHPVQGKVLFKQQPAEGAQVVFQPVGGAGEAQPLTPSGTTAADGSFTLNTYPHGEGAVAGDYVVLVSWYPPNARDEANP